MYATGVCRMHKAAALLKQTVWIFAKVAPDVFLIWTADQGQGAAEGLLGDGSQILLAPGRYYQAGWQTNSGTAKKNIFQTIIWLWNAPWNCRTIRTQSAWNWKWKQCWFGAFRVDVWELKLFLLFKFHAVWQKWGKKATNCFVFWWFQTKLYFFWHKKWQWVWLPHRQYNEDKFWVWCIHQNTFSITEN